MLSKNEISARSADDLEMLEGQNPSDQISILGTMSEERKKAIVELIQELSSRKKVARLGLGKAIDNALDSLEEKPSFSNSDIQSLISNIEEAENHSDTPVYAGLS